MPESPNRSLPAPPPASGDAAVIAMGQWDWDPATDEVRMSGEVARYLGVPVGPDGRHALYRALDLVHPDDVPDLRAAAASALRGQRSWFALQYRLRSRSGEWRWFQAHGHVAERDAGGRVRRMSGITVDVTEGRRDAERARRRDRRFRDLVEAFVDWYWEMDADLRYVRLEGRSLGVPDVWLARMVGRHPWESGAVPVETTWDAVRGALERHEPFRDLLLRREREDGRVTYRRISGRPLFDAEGRFEGYHGVAQDATALVQSQLALAASEARFRDFALASGDWMSETDAEGRYTWFSDAVFDKRGVPPSWFIGRRRTDLARAGTDFDAEPWRSFLATVASRQPFRDFRYEALDAAGPITISTSGVPVFDPADGAFLGYRNVTSDVSEQVALEARAHGAETQLRAAFEHVQQGVVLCDAEDRILFANSAFRRNTAGLEDVVAPGTPYVAFLRAAVAGGRFPQAIGREEAWLADRLAMRATAPGQVEQQLRDGRWRLISDYPLPGGGIITFALDITERRERQERLDAEAQAQRLALVREVHHRIKNNLQGIATLLDLRAADHPAAAGALRDAIQQIQAVARVHGMFGRGAEQLRVGVLVQDIAEAAGGGLRAIVHENASGGDWLLDEQDAVAVALVVNELVWNAVKHSDPGSRDPVRLRLERMACDGARITVLNRGTLHVSGADDGVGLGLARMLLPPRTGSIEVAGGSDEVRASVTLLAPTARWMPAPPV